MNTGSRDEQANIARIAQALERIATALEREPAQEPK
jgi:hypothetical protein